MQIQSTAIAPQDVMVFLIVTSLYISLPLPTLHGGKYRILPFISGWKARVSRWNWSLGLWAAVYGTVVAV